jgi:hypothetical protein
MAEQETAPRLIFSINLLKYKVRVLNNLYNRSEMNFLGAARSLSGLARLVFGSFSV